MAFRNIRPLHVLWQAGIEEYMLDGVFSGIAYVLWLAGVSKEIKIERMGQRRQKDWCNQVGMLEAYKSFDWHIWLAHQQRRIEGHLNSAALIGSLAGNPDHKSNPKYEFAVVNEPLHWHYNSTRSVGGSATPGQNAVISLAGYTHLLQPIDGEKDEDRKKRQLDYFLGTQLVAIHECGHKFNLYPGTCVQNPTNKEIEKAHCPNKCVMSWDMETWKKSRHKPYCTECLTNLEQNFIAP